MMQGRGPSRTVSSRRRAARSPSATARHERGGSSPPAPHQMFGAEVRPAPSPRRRPVDIETEPSVRAPRVTGADSVPGAVARSSAPGRDSKLVQLARSAEARRASHPEAWPPPARTWEPNLDARSSEASRSGLHRDANVNCANGASVTAAPYAVRTASTITTATVTRRAIDLAHTALRVGDFNQASTVLSQRHAQITDTGQGQGQGALCVATGQRSPDTLQQVQLEPEPESEQQPERTRQSEKMTKTSAPRRLRAMYIDGGDRPTSRGSDVPPKTRTEGRGAENRIPLVE